MKKLLVLFIGLIVVSCNNETSNFTLNANIKGLKKGTAYLKKFSDSAFVSIDSIAINGQETFTLHAQLDEPEMLFLNLDKNAGEDGTLAFFADKGTTEINTTLKNFNFDATIKGSKQQTLLDEYLKMNSKFNDNHLELIKDNLERQKENDSASFNYQEEYNKLLKRRYLFTINFAINHKDSEVAPYLALSEIPNTTTKHLKTIYDSLTAPIQESKYGKALKQFIEERINLETSN